MRMRLLALPVVVALTVTGCSSGALSQTTPMPTPSATAEGSECARISADLAALSLNVGLLLEEFGSNPLGALLRIGTVVDQATSLNESVQDPELRERLDAILASLENVAAEAQAAASSSDPGSAVTVVTDGLTQVQSDIDALIAYCGAA